MPAAGAAAALVLPRKYLPSTARAPQIRPGTRRRPVPDQTPAERDYPLVAERPESITQVPPGEVDFDLLEDSGCELTERYDPGGNLEESWVSCDVLRWRTDFVPPGTIHPPDKVFEECTTWRVSQWQWVPPEDDDADEDELYQAGEWMLRAHAPITAQEVAGHLPESLLQWVRRMTLDGAEWMADLAESEPRFAAAAKRLRAASEGLP